MPSKYTFEIKPIRELLMQYMPNGLVIDPFANKSKLASVTNDLDTNYDTDFHLDATDFLAMFQDASVDMVLYDPPYSARHIEKWDIPLICRQRRTATGESIKNRSAGL